MQASRLLSMLMLLQSRRKMSAAALAEELEVSVRTVYRDVEQLSSAGVPVVVTRGMNGGFELLEGWRTRLTGLTAGESQAMFLAGASGAATQLGLGEAVASAQLKLLAALPAEWQADAHRIGSRFHLDSAPWYQHPPRPDALAAVAEAVWHERRLAIRYESWRGAVERLIEPLGLVLKAGEWYLIATAGREPQTYRLSNILTLEARPGAVRRPRHFDLAKHWAASLARFESELYRGTALLRVSATGFKWLCRISAAVNEAAQRSANGVDARGWRRVTIPIETPEHAASQLIRLADEAEVLEPPELRRLMAATTTRMAKLYARHTRKGGAAAQ
jgi:predicted DNA-binding transcriptional regulator YafY